MEKKVWGGGGTKKARKSKREKRRTQRGCKVKETRRPALI